MLKTLIQFVTNQRDSPQCAVCLISSGLIRVAHKDTLYHTMHVNKSMVTSLLVVVTRVSRIKRSVSSLSRNMDVRMRVGLVGRRSLTFEVTRYWMETIRSTCSMSDTHFMQHVTMDFNVAKIASSASIVTKSSTISLRVAGPLL